jgi:hypothetical protein
MSKFLFLTRYQYEEEILVNLDNVSWMQKCGRGQLTHTKIHFGVDEDDFIAVAESPTEILVELLEE